MSDQKDTQFQSTHLQARFEERSARLARLISIKGPGIVIALELQSVLRTAWALHPDAMAKIIGERERDVARRWAGICTRCGTNDAVKTDVVELLHGLCNRCSRELEIEARNWGVGESGDES